MLNWRQRTANQLADAVAKGALERNNAFSFNSVNVLSMPSDLLDIARKDMM